MISILVYQLSFYKYILDLSLWSGTSPIVYKLARKKQIIFHFMINRLLKYAAAVFRQKKEFIQWRSTKQKLLEILKIIFFFILMKSENEAVMAQKP